MNKCPNCGETAAVSMMDKLFRTGKMACQHCGTKLQVPPFTNQTIIIIVVLSWAAAFMLDLTTTTQFIISFGIIIIAVIVIIFLPLQIKENSS